MKVIRFLARIMARGIRDSLIILDIPRNRAGF
jgi:hypothetical protein